MGKRLASFPRTPLPLSPHFRHVFEITKLVGVIELDNPFAGLRRAAGSGFFGGLRLAVHRFFDSHESKSPAHPGIDTGMNRARLTIYEVSAGEGASPEQCARCTLRKFGGGQACGKEPRLFRGRRQGCGMNLDRAASGVWRWGALQTRAVSDLGCCRCSGIWIGIQSGK